jgi:hypothetical protein
VEALGGFLVHALFFMIVSAVLVHRWFLWLICTVADDLLCLFRRDEERWWPENELPEILGRSGFLTRAALNLLNDKRMLLTKSILPDASFGYTYGYSREGGVHLGAMLLVRLDSGADTPKKKEKKVRAKKPAPALIPVHRAPLDSLRP